MTPDTLSLRQLNRATLARQLLLARESLSATDAVERLGGLQAQDARPPFIGLWARLDGFERRDLQQALTERAIVRGTAMRGTLHLLTAADFAALRTTFQPVLDGGLRALGDRAKGLDADAVLPLARKLLRERPRGFEELRTLLQEAFPDVNHRALGFTVRMQIPLVMVPTDDRWSFPSTADFTLADEWLGAPLSGSETDAEREAGLRALVRRHLGAFGPATAADVQAWSGLKGLRPVLEGMRDELLLFRDERRRALFDLPDAPRPDPDVPAPARFLPDFDSLVLAHADRTRVIADEHRGALTTKNLRVRATFLWDGVVAGTWSVERRRGVATLRAVPFARLPRAARAALGEEAEALLRFAEEDARGVDVRFAAPGGVA